MWGVGGCSGLSFLGDRLRDGDLRVGAVFGGVLETDAWSGGLVNKGSPGRHLAVVGALTTRPQLVLWDGPSAWPERTCHW